MRQGRSKRDRKKKEKKEKWIFGGEVGGKGVDLEKREGDRQFRKREKKMIEG